MLFYAALIIGVLIMCYLISRRVMVRRALRKAPQKSIADFNDGDIGKIVGRVVFVGKPLTAPFSQRRCVWYHVIVDENRRRMNEFSEWRTVIEEEMIGNVVIFDGKNYAVVNTSNVRSYLVSDREYFSSEYDGITKQVDAFLEKHKQRSTTFGGRKRYMRYREAVLEENELFAVAGKGHWRKAADIKLDLPVEMVLVVSTQDKKPVFVSDDPRVVRSRRT